MLGGVGKGRGGGRRASRPGRSPRWHRPRPRHDPDRWGRDGEDPTGEKSMDAQDVWKLAGMRSNLCQSCKLYVFRCYTGPKRP